MFRLLRLAVSLAVLVAVAVVLVKFVAVPVIEDQAADAIGARLGAPVTVGADAPVRPGLLRGELGTLVVKADEVRRSGITLRTFRAHVIGAKLDLGSLVEGDPALTYRRVQVRVTVEEAELTALLRRRGARAEVQIERGVMNVVAAGAPPLAVRVAIVPPDTIRLVPQAPAGVLAGALAQAIDLGPLPYGLRLRSVQLRPGRAVVIGDRGPGRAVL